jgi:hypothetical protein
MNIVQQKKTTTKNITTGEIKEEENEQIIKYPKTEDFVMTFTKDLGYMKNLTRGEILLTFGLLQNVQRNSNHVVINKGIKEIISEQFDINVRSINNQLSSLKKKKIIIPTDKTGIFLLNTNLFGKGKWSEIKKMRMLIEWDFNTQTKKMMVEQEYINKK